MDRQTIITLLAGIAVGYYLVPKLAGFAGVGD